MRIWDRIFPNPIGMAAGFDKDAEVFDALTQLGFGFVEVGSITPKPQPGNPKPRLFRLSQDNALINRMGFNSGGLSQARRNLAKRQQQRDGIVGVNLGKNKDADAEADYAAGLRALAPFADYLVINVSSPNTPGLRALQSAEILDSLLAALLRARSDAGLDPPPPLLLKLAPDLSPAELGEISALALRRKVDGLVIGNTTLARPPSLHGPHVREAGGLSGAPLYGLSTEVLREVYRLTEGRIPLIGVGGVASGKDAYGKIRAGASLVQLYTALVYQGPGLVRRLKVELAALLRRDGFTSVGEAVGADHRAVVAR
jgi:dihydroorotate dehydrogenase